MDKSHSLKKSNCLEWRVPVSGGMSEKFRLRNQECFFNFCKTSRPKETANSLYFQSQSKLPISFTVTVPMITDTGVIVRSFSPSTRSVQGGYPHKVWLFNRETKFLAKDDIVSFMVMFPEGWNVELAEDAHGKTEVEPQTSCSEKTQISLKKVTCLKWICQGQSPSYCPRYKMISPKFVIGNQECFFVRTRGPLRGNHQVQFTLAIESDDPCYSDTYFPHYFDVTIHVAWKKKGSTFDRKTVKRFSLYNFWTSQLENTDEDIYSFELYFPNYLNVKLNEDADAKAMTGSEESPSTSDQFTQTSSFRDSEISHRSLSSDLGKLLQSNDSKPDVTIQCRRCTIPAHQNILATRSTKLKAMLQKNMAKSDSRILQIKDMEASVCRKFVEYLYTASLPDLSAELALDLHEAGMKYDVESLKRQCCDFLIEYLSAGDVPRDIIDNDDILNSSQWACFTESQPTLVSQMFQRAYKKAKRM